MHEQTSTCVFVIETCILFLRLHLLLYTVNLHPQGATIFYSFKMSCFQLWRQITIFAKRVQIYVGKLTEVFPMKEEK